MIFNIFCFLVPVIVFAKCSNDSLINSSIGRLQETTKSFIINNETFHGSQARATTTGELMDQNTEMKLKTEMVLPRVNIKLRAEPPYSVSSDDIAKIQEIDNYYKRVSTELPDPDVISKHRIFLSKMSNHLKMMKNPDNKLSSKLKELLSTITTITDHKSLNSSKNSSTIFEVDDNHSNKDLFTHDTSENPANYGSESSKSDPSSKKHFELSKRPNSKLSSISEGTQPFLLNRSDENYSRDFPSIESKIPSSSLSKRSGQLSSGPLFSTPLLNQRQRPQNSLLKFHQSFPTLESSLFPQEVEHKRGAPNQGMLQLISQSLRTPVNISESPLAITDAAALEEEISEKLLELLIQANQGGSISNFSALLEKALAELTKATPPNVNKNIPTNVKPAGTAAFGSSLELIEGLSPEVLASLLVRLQLPTTEELTAIKNQLSNLVKVVGQGTNLETVNPANLNTILTDISTSIVTIITSIAMICTTNPLICVLAAVALCALIFHLYKHKYGKKKYKDTGYGHDSGGYHRKNFYDYDTFRRLDDDTQAEVTSNILGKIDVFDDWVKSVKDFQ